MREFETDQRVENIPTTPTNQTGRGTQRFLLEFASQAFVTQLELLRSAMTHSEAFGPLLMKRDGTPFFQPLDAAKTDPNIYQILQHSGDFYDAFTISFIGYNAIAFIDSIQSVFTRRRLPEKLTLGLSLAAGAISVMAVESGLAFHSTPDYTDIPAGLLGVACYGGIHMLSRKISGLSTAKNKARQQPAL